MSRYIDAEEIKCGLEHCTAKSYKCEECPYFYKSEGLKSSMEILMTDALALITSQEQRIGELTEEVESLNGKVSQYEEERKYHFEMSRKRIAEAKADTVREMQERLKECLPYGFERSYHKVIDQIAKEMIGGEE